MSGRPRISSPKTNTVGGWGSCRSTSAELLRTHLKDKSHCCQEDSGQTHSDGFMSERGRRGCEGREPRPFITSVSALTFQTRAPPSKGRS